jgi:hypothetical protein
MAAKKAYNIVYTVNAYKEAKPVEWIKKNGLGGADAVVLVALYRDGENLDLRIMTMDGATCAPMKDLEIFNVWGALARFLSEANGLKGGAKDVVTKVWDLFSRSVQSKAKKMTKGFMS